MALSAVELYERLKPQLGENETKALIEYVDEKIRGEVATKEDLLLLKAELKEGMGLLKEDLLLLKAEMKEDLVLMKDDMVLMKTELKEDLWKLRMLVIVTLVAMVALNPKVLELVGRVLGMGK